MMRVWRHTLLFGAIAMAWIPVPARAQPAPASAAAKAQARQYVDAGLAAQDAGDYDAALGFYQKAYALVPHPVLLFDMAQAQRLAGRLEQALALYARYLDADPNGPQAQTARDNVAELQARRPDEAGVAATAAGPAPPAAPPGSPPGRTLQLSGIAAAGVGVVGLGLGVGFGLHGRSLSDELSRKGAMYDQGKVDAGNRANVIEVTGFVGGAVLIAAGATLYWWGHTQDRRSEGVAVAPMVSTQLAGLVVTGTLP